VKKQIKKKKTKKKRCYIGGGIWLVPQTGGALGSKELLSDHLLVSVGEKRPPITQSQL